MGALQDLAATPPMDCRPDERLVRSPIPPYRWRCRPLYVVPCAPRILTGLRMEQLKAKLPDAYSAGCKVFDPACPLPSGWISARSPLPSPPHPNVPNPPPDHVIACPPTCFVYEDAPPTPDDPIPYCCPGHPDCTPESNDACGGRPCPPGSVGTRLHPQGWGHPDYPWFDAYQICCGRPVQAPAQPHVARTVRAMRSARR